MRSYYSIVIVLLLCHNRIWEDESYKSLNGHGAFQCEYKEKTTLSLLCISSHHLSSAETWINELSRIYLKKLHRSPMSFKAVNLIAAF